MTDTTESNELVEPLSGEIIHQRGRRRRRPAVTTWLVALLKPAGKGPVALRTCAARSKNLGPGRDIRRICCVSSSIWNNWEGHAQEISVR